MMWFAAVAVAPMALIVMLASTTIRSTSSFHSPVPLLLLGRLSKKGFATTELIMEVAPIRKEHDFKQHREVVSLVRLEATTKEEVSFDKEKEGSSVASAVAVLITVPVAWGTFEVAVRYVYAVEPPVPAFLFQLAYYTVASIALIIGAALLSTTRLQQKNESCDAAAENDNRPNIDDDDDDSVFSLAMTTTAATKKEEESSWPILGGFELGSYLFLGNLLQVVGLQTVASDRAAFCSN